MHRKLLFMLSVLMGLGLFSGAALAQSAGNQSDNTGTIVEPSIEFSEPDTDSSTIDVEILEYAQELSQNLELARIACESTREVAVGAPRRFARGPGPVICVNPDCERLRVLTIEAREFLSNLDAAQAERLRQSQTLTFW